MSYTNADGLRILTHGDQGVVRTQGASTVSGRQTLVVNLTGTDIGSSFGASNIDPLAPVIPAGSIIVNADLVVETAFTSGGAATLTIGTYDATGAAVDADGIDAAIALTVIDAVGDVVQCDGAQVSALKTVGSADVYVGAIYGTAAYTAGQAKLVIEYIKV